MVTPDFLVAGRPDNRLAHWRAGIRCDSPVTIRAVLSLTLFACWRNSASSESPGARTAAKPWPDSRCQGRVVMSACAASPGKRDWRNSPISIHATGWRSFFRAPPMLLQAMHATATYAHWCTNSWWAERRGRVWRSARSRHGRAKVPANTCSWSQPAWTPRRWGKLRSSDRFAPVAIFRPNWG